MVWGGPEHHGGGGGVLDASGYQIQRHKTPELEPSNTRKQVAQNPVE